MEIALLLLLYFGVPVLLQWAAKQYSWIDKVGVVTLCYIAGILFGNIPGAVVPEYVAKPLLFGAVLLAIPLLLFSSNIKVWRTMGVKLTLSFFFCVISVAIAATIGTYLFKNHVPDAWIVGSMLTGVYTGGTPNLNAIGLSLGVDRDSLIIINGAEMAFGAIWLLLLLTIAKPMLGKILKPTIGEKHHVEFALDEKMYWKTTPLALGVAVVGGAIAFGIAFLCFDIESPFFMAAVFLIATTLGIVGSLSSVIKRLNGSYGLGNFLLLVFCVVIGSLANAREIFSAAPMLLGFVAFVMFSTILLHFVLCILFRIDIDTFIIASAAGIFGPPFIPPVAKAIRNPYIIPVGLALGVFGLAIGNYCGLGISNILRLF